MYDNANNLSEQEYCTQCNTAIHGAAVMEGVLEFCNTDCLRTWNQNLPSRAS